MTLSTFIPDQQEQKLELIKATAATLGPALSPDTVSPPPTDAENVAVINSTVDALTKLAGQHQRPGAGRGQTAGGGDDDAGEGRSRRRASAPRWRSFSRCRRRSTMCAICSRPSRLPAKTCRKVSSRNGSRADGKARLQISPSGNANDNTTLRTFAHDVQQVEPNATEGPISILEARRTIITAFLQAAAWALLSIAVLLWLTLRRLGDVLLTLIPLLVAGVVTLEICVAIDMPLNFANIIALPLLLGVGVAFKIYYIMAWREGQTKLLQSVLTRAVTFSACTTATAFGSLYFSSDPGHLEHGQTAGDRAVDHHDGGGGVSAGADGQAARGASARARPP